MTSVRPFSTAVLVAFPFAAVQADLVRMVPEHLWDGIAEYVNRGRPTGGFLRAVFENDLARAAMQADEINFPRLAEIALFVLWHCPSACRGSTAAVKVWIMQHRAARAEE